jgi:uncharacterized protein (DUF3084 family)
MNVRAWAALCIAAVSLPAWPQAAQGSGTMTKPTAPAQPLSRAELRACMDQRDQLQSHQESIGKRNAEVQAEAEKVNATSAQLEQIKARLDPRAQDLVEPYNQLTHDHNLRLYAYKAKSAQLEKDIGQFNALVNAYNGSCLGRPFLKADEEALLKERAARPAAPASQPGG